MIRIDLTAVSCDGQLSDENRPANLDGQRFLTVVWRQLSNPLGTSVFIKDTGVNPTDDLSISIVPRSIWSLQKST